MNRSFVLLSASLISILFSTCGMEVIPDRDYITKKECLKDTVEEKGDWDSSKVLDSYTDGEERKVKIVWNIDETTTDENDVIYHFDEYYYIIWNNTDIYNKSWEYGWNILDGPHRSN